MELHIHNPPSPTYTLKTDENEIKNLVKYVQQN